MNRETLDDIIKQGLRKYADDVLGEIGKAACGTRWGTYGDAADLVSERERARNLIADDGQRLKIVDAILKEMTS